MTVSGVLIVIMAILYAAGIYAMLERSLTRVLIGFLLLGNATNLFLLVVMGRPGVAAFFGSANGVDAEDMSDPLPQALTLTAIVITFAVSAFLLALIYRSWQLGQADTVHDDEEDVALRDLRDRGAVEEDEMDDETSIEDEDDDATTDFIGTDTAPITVLHHRDLDEIRDDAPSDHPQSRHPRDGGDAS
ncbi:MAG: Na(+)/H(+) antiporter subunit C [Microbacterium sp.]|uniref:Na(+)/H(+) antiporter subunit C n=1 Tax=Microbacterium sp. TaxID=51671 RepID=UPI001AD42493|nr:Na(+)/H(+) antiporter subunit C [Microbacterium sp.]MBN9176833.1 Na(+)/H(+) antiporter subunit C [Microbacterium sp.]